jgi:membrane associated rhomboid family serine protease
LADLIFTPQTHKITWTLSADAYSLVRPWMWWQLLTSGFVHSPYSLGHIASNMLGLYFLGKYVEQLLGRWEFLRFYLLAIIVGAVVHTARVCLTVAPLPLSPQDPWAIPMLGASGAVVATVLLFIFHFPRVQLLLFFVIPVPAWLVGVLLIGYNVLGSGGIFLPLSGPEAANIAYDVHLAGAAFAALYYYLGWNLGRWIPRSLGDALSGAKRVMRPRPKLEIHTPDEDEWNDSRYRDLDDEADRILAKINTQGEGSLTAAERRVLEDYSRRMRQKHR